MPTNLTDVDSFDTATGPTGADIRNAADVRSHLQKLANRTRYLFNRINPLADTAALKAINTTGMSTGVSRFVTGQGDFTFDSTSLLTENIPFVITPTTGPGRWIAATAHRTTKTLRIFPGQHCVATHIFPNSADTAFVFTADGTLSGGTNKHPTSDQAGRAFASKFGALVAVVDNASRRVYQIDLPVPDGATITSIVARLTPSGAAIALPSQMPFLGAVRMAGTGTPMAAHMLAAGLVFDSSPNVGAYNIEHTITYTPDQNNVVDLGTYRYGLFLGQSSGAAGFGNGDMWRSVDVTISIPDVRGA